MRTYSRRGFNLAFVSAAAVPSLAGTAIAASKETKVVLLLSGVISDGGWGQLAYEGIKELAKAGFKTAYAENISQAQIPQVARGYADDGYDLVIGHGFEFGSTLLEIAPDYPKTKFFVSTFQPQPGIPDNIQFVNLAYLDAAYGAGALAALSSEKKKAVGFVGGGDNPTQQGMMKAFVAAAERTVPGVKGLGIVTGDYNNAAKGKEAAATMIGNGADVIWHAADVTGLGAIQGAVAGHAKVIGCYSDQTKLAPDSMVTSFVMNLSHMVVAAATSVADGKFAGGTEWKPTVTEMWLLKAGDTDDHNPKLISAENWDAFEKIWADLGARKLSAADLIK